MVERDRLVTYEGQRWRLLFRQRDKAVLQRLHDGALHTVAWAEIAVAVSHGPR